MSISFKRIQHSGHTVLNSQMARHIYFLCENEEFFFVGNKRTEEIDKDFRKAQKFYVLCGCCFLEMTLSIDNCNLIQSC